MVDATAEDLLDGGERFGALGRDFSAGKKLGGVDSFFGLSQERQSMNHDRAGFAQGGGSVFFADGTECDSVLDMIVMVHYYKPP